MTTPSLIARSSGGSAAVDLTRSPDQFAARDRTVDPAREAELREAAVAFEAAFLAEMLRHAGAGRGAPGFDGGAGEAAFAQELVKQQATAIAERGGIGLAQLLFESMLLLEA